MITHEINIEDVLKAAEKYITFTYSHELHYSALIWKTLIDEFKVPVDRAFLDSPWISEEWDDRKAPSKKERPDIVVLSGPPSDRWCGDTKVFSPADYKKALLVLEVKKISSPVSYMQADIERLARIRNESYNKSTQVALVIIDDQLHVVDDNDPNQIQRHKKWARTYMVSKLPRLYEFAENYSVPVHKIDFPLLTHQSDLRFSGQ